MEALTQFGLKFGVRTTNSIIRLMMKLKEEKLLELYEAYLNGRGCRMAKIPESSAETPDLEVTFNNVQILNELKAPELIIDPATNLYKFKTTISKLLRLVDKATNQLSSYDHKHAQPWVITLASNHFQLNWKNFTDALQGGVIFDGEVASDFTNTAVFQQALKKIREPDVYLWLQVSQDNSKLYQASYILNDETNHRKEVGQLIEKLSTIPLSSMDNTFALS